MKVTIIRGRASESTIHRVAESLSKYGYDVTLLLWDKQNLWNEEKIIDNKKKYGFLIKRFCLKSPEDHWTVYFFFPFWFLYQIMFLLKDDSGIIHAVDLDTLWPAIICKILKKKKLCYTIYDFYANNIVSARFNLVINPVRNFISWLEKTGIGFTDALFLVDDCRLKEVEGSKIKRMAIIYNSPPDITNNNQRKAAKELEFTIFYTGLIHKNRGLEFIIKAIKDIKNVKLILGGVGPDLERLENMAKEMHGMVEFIGWTPYYEEVLEKTLNADLLFRFNDPIVPKSKYESPNKLFEAMMCGKPIILNEELAASKIVVEENCGILVKYGDVKAIRDAILFFKNNPEACKELGLNGRRAYDNKYSWKIMEEKLLKVYNDVK